MNLFIHDGTIIPKTLEPNAKPKLSAEETDQKRAPGSVGSLYVFFGD